MYQKKGPLTLLGCPDECGGYTTCSGGGTTWYPQNTDSDSDSDSDTDSGESESDGAVRLITDAYLAALFFVTCLSNSL